ncbi:DUF2572 family protein [Turicibacter sp. TJ11]|uniref:DUF2572 family protein n=1 Tax=Turicibacter sp. TJ11 TaxID=2806443 RepID=UPI001F21B2D0|nr:DUF2572 family protein [Turicibacter sp. TJ11]
MKKKKGSSLISVTVFTAIIITVAVTSLSVVANDYKTKVNESKKVANLYGAESGLNMAYNVLVKVFNYAVDVANHEVETQFDSELNLDESQEQNNEIFQDTFIKVFESSLSSDSSLEIENTNIINYCLTHQVYPLFDEKEVIFEPFDFTSSDQLSIQVDQKRTDNKFTFTFTSDFSSSTQSQQSNERQVSVKYHIYVPTYQGVIKENISVVTIENFPVVSDSVVNIDKNASLTGNIQIKGNLRAKGSELLDSNDVVYGKYQNGIQMNNGSLRIEGNMVTNETLSLHQKANVEITDDILARNVYIGKKQVVEEPTEANLSVSGSVLLDNDLVVNVQPQPNDSQSSTVTLKNLYGLNDKNIYSVEKSQPIKESSSLIVNSEGASVTVEEETYLSGVAYIDTKDEPYQTGESVAIRGNYLVYSEILPGYESRVQMKYYNPLLLVESIDRESSIDKKASYFVEASEKGQLKLSDGGVSLNPEQTYTVGAAISNDQVINSNMPLDPDDPKSKNLEAKKVQYASHVYNMGMTATKDNYEKGSVIKTVANQINFNHTTFLKEISDFNHAYGNIILNKNKDIDILITAQGDGTNNITYIKKWNEDNKENKENVQTIDGVTKALIITNGDVKLVGNVQLTGNIISAGNLEIDESNKDSGNIELIFDKEVTQQMIAANYKDLEGIFKVDSVFYDTTKVEVVDGFDLGDIQTNYYPEDYIRAGRWQLLK